MTIQKVSAGRGAAWVNESIGLLKSGGKAIWIPALLIGILSALPKVGVLIFVFTVIFYGSMVLSINDSSREPSILKGFQNGNFVRILPIFAVWALFFGLVIIAFWPLIYAIYLMELAGQTTMDPVLAEKLMESVSIHFLWVIPTAIFLSWLNQFAIPLATISKLNGFQAMQLAFKAMLTNLSALFINLLCMTLVALIFGLVGMILLIIISTIFATNQTMLELALIPVFGLLTAVNMAFLSANMFYAYRDVFDEDATAPVAANSEILL